MFPPHLDKYANSPHGRPLSDCIGNGLSHCDINGHVYKYTYNGQYKYVNIYSDSYQYFGACPDGDEYTHPGGNEYKYTGACTDEYKHIHPCAYGNKYPRPIANQHLTACRADGHAYTVKIGQ